MLDSDAARQAVVRAKADKWADELIDFGPYNTLLHFKDNKTSMLDLTACRRDALVGLLSGKKTRLSALVSSEDLHGACLRARNLRRKVVEMEEEQGIDAGRLSLGLLKVDRPAVRGTSPVLPIRAPLLVQPINLEARTTGETDYTIDLAGEAAVNPVLLYALNRQYGVDLDPDTIEDKLNAAIDEVSDPTDQVTRVYDLLAELARRSGLATSLERKTVLGLFSYEKMPMVTDLRSATKLLASHDVIAAAAGHGPAADAMFNQVADYQPAGPDDVTPANEFLVLPADSSQQRAINAVLDGHHVVIQGPPGTGKSQTIANIIASGVARGKRVLFVAEKRAAIEAVTEGLESVDLGHLVFDLHQRKLNRRDVATQMAASLERAGQELPAATDGLHARLHNRRTRVQEHVRVLGDRRDPWQVSAYGIYTALLDLPSTSHNDIRFRGSQLRGLSGDTLTRVQDDLMEFVNTGGLAVRRGESPWSRSQVRDASQIDAVLATLDSLTGNTWRTTQQQLEDLVDRAGIARPSSMDEWQQVLGLLGAVERTVATYGEEIFGDELDQLCYATGDRSWRARNPQPIGWWRRRALRKQAAAMRRAGRCDRAVLHRELIDARSELDVWRRAATSGGHPLAVPGLTGVLQRFTGVRDQIAAVALCARLDEPQRWPSNRVETKLAELRADQATLYRMPTLNRITDSLTKIGLASLLDELMQRDVDADGALALFRYSWYSSLLDEYRMRLPHLARFSGRQHDQVVADFAQADRNHFQTNPQRIRRLVAERLRAVRDAHPQQNTTVLGQSKLRRRHLPVRKLVERAPDVLLAARPCWAMSPIVVSRLLPAQRLFDIVIFDEASQIEPHDAMTSIMRGTQLVVAGDERQLPPNRFFQRALAGDADEEEADDEEAVPRPEIGDYESILACLAALIPRPFLLRWHYRSQDERLIAFSNHEIYDDELVTFPGRDRESPLRLEAVEGQAPPGAGGICAEEVRRVMDLVLDHVWHYPEQSLGLITTGVKQARRLEMELRETSRQHDPLAEYQARMQGPRKRLFVKSIEQVQGDERDVIIFSIGRSKRADGRLPMSFGHINHEGGERRLNVAVTRARRRMYVVSAFTHHDMAPDWSTRGPELLRRFLELAAGTTAPQDTGRASPTELNGFERSIRDALVEREVPVTPQWGVSGYRIDFALAHPEQPGRMVLAVEADGDQYHRAASARDRDRLRQEHLEKLGWRFVRVWASEWFADPKGQTERIIERWREAIAAADRPVETPSPGPSPAPATVTPDRGPRPPITKRASIDGYTHEELVDLCQWLLRDQLALDRETRIGQAMAQIGFTRRGKKIVERLNAALDDARR